MAAAPYRAIKVQSPTYDKLQVLAAQIAREGWQSVGVDRDDAATLTSVVDAAVTALSTARPSRSRSRSRK